MPAWSICTRVSRSRFCAALFTTCRIPPGYSRSSKRSSRLEASDWYDSAVLGGLDALSSGITTVADITSTGAACTATQKLGLRGVIYREVGAMDKMRVAHAMRSAENDIMHWREGGRFQPHHHRHRARGRSTPTIRRCSRASPNARARTTCPWPCASPAVARSTTSSCTAPSMFAVHTMDDSKRGYVEIPPWMPTGVTPVRYALNWGAFESPNVLLIHAVHVDDEDIKKLREYDVSICTCARANAQLGMGVAPPGISCAPGSTWVLAPTPGGHRVDRLAHRDARRHAHPPSGRHAPLPRFDHHAGARHHRRRPRSGSRGQDRLDRDRKMRRSHRRRFVRLAPSTAPIRFRRW